MASLLINYIGIKALSGQTSPGKRDTLFIVALASEPWAAFQAFWNTQGLILRSLSDHLPALAPAKEAQIRAPLASRMPMVDAAVNTFFAEHLSRGRLRSVPLRLVDLAFESGGLAFLVEGQMQARTNLCPMPGRALNALSAQWKRESARATISPEELAWLKSQVGQGQGEQFASDLMADLEGLRVPIFRLGQTLIGILR